MNHNAILALAIPGTRTVRVRYPSRFMERFTEQSAADKLYTFLCDIPDVAAGDYVIVGPTSSRDFPVTVQVAEVDATPVVNFTNPEKAYRWIWQKVDVKSGIDKQEKLKALANQLAAVDYLVQQNAAMDRYLAILPKDSAAYAMMEAAKTNLSKQALSDNSAAYAVLAGQNGY